MVTFKYAMDSIRDWECYQKLIKKFKVDCKIKRKPVKNKKMKMVINTLLFSLMFLFLIL